MNKTFEGFKEDKAELEHKILGLLRDFEQYYEVGIDSIWLHSHNPFGNLAKSLVSVSIRLEI